MGLRDTDHADPMGPTQYTWNMHCHSSSGLTRFCSLDGGAIVALIPANNRIGLEVPQGGRTFKAVEQHKPTVGGHGERHDGKVMRWSGRRDLSRSRVPLLDCSIRRGRYRSIVGCPHGVPHFVAVCWKKDKGQPRVTGTRCRVEQVNAYVLYTRER